ncbi:MAG TPA: hypothetical protein VFC24_16160 [Casimicrobiaceae bacterium]|nr:hypothetical protein [Casimicrobiaceae bacterium]
MRSLRAQRSAIVIALGVATLLSGAVHGAGGTLVPNGGCRDGQPNGAYELRGNDGRLRVVGAFHDGRRTGTFIFWNGSGARIAAIPYDENVRNGTIALWHVRGRPSHEIGRRLEAPVVKGEPHGVHRAWHLNGKLQYEATYEHGRLASAKAWDANGRALAEAEAQRIALAARKRDEAYVAMLEKMVADHQPRCDDSARAELAIVHRRS